MMLTPGQQTALDNHLRETNQLTNEELIQELADHYTDAIHERMAHGLTFETALVEVQATFGGRAGLSDLQRQYIQSKNRAGWATFRTVMWSYLTFPRLLITVSLLAGTYWLLISFWQKAFIALLIGNVALYIIVGWPEFEWRPKRWKYEWNNVSIQAYVGNRVGIFRIIRIAYIVAFNLPVFLYLFFFPFTFNRLFDSSFPVFSAVGITISYVCFFCIAELSYPRNELLKRFV